MKIQNVTPESHPKISSLLKKAFPGSGYESALFANLHTENRTMYEWVCIHRKKVIAYIGYTNAYRGKEVYGLHLGPFAVSPNMQNKGIGTELLRFSLRQGAIKDKRLFVLGDPYFYQRFGFTLCKTPICPFDKNNRHFLSIGNTEQELFSIGYEPEFKK